MERPTLELLATSGNPDGSLPANGSRELEFQTRKPASFFKSVQWSADGTTLFTTSSENRVCTFVLPENLLDPSPEPVHLKAHGTLVLAEPTSAIAPSPYFSLQDASTQVILTGTKDHPIQLHYAFAQQHQQQQSSSPSSPSSPSDNDTTTFPTSLPQQPPIASYPLIKPETEAYLPITSLLWPLHPGTHFLAGTTNLLALFDVSRPDIPPTSIPTTTTSSTSRHHGFGMRGTVSALSIQPNSGDAGGGGLVAAGTWTRSLGLYDLQRAGECVATWSLGGLGGMARDPGGIGGNGVMQTAWSPCGRYLIVNERSADGLLVYDVRGEHKLLACLMGRGGRTTQRLSCDVFPGSESGVGGFEVWSGTAEGNLVVWEGVGEKEGHVEPSWGKKGAHGSTVGAAAMHMAGSVLATCSGSWKFLDDDSDSDSDSDCEDDSEESSSSDESTSGSSVGQVSVKKTRAPMVVEETSIKVWNIRAGSGSSESERPATADECTET